MFVQLLRFAMKPLLTIIESEGNPSISGGKKPEDIDYRYLFENAAAGIGRTSVGSGRVIFANPRLAEIFGYDSVDQFIQEYNFSDRYPDQEGGARQFDFYRNNPGELAQASFTNRQGETIYVESEVRLDPGEEYVDFVIIDVSDREKATREKRRLESIVDSIMHQSHIPMALKDLDDRYLYVSPAYARYLGLTIDEMEGSTTAEILDQENAARVLTADQKVINSGMALDIDEAFPVKIGDATLHVYKFPIYDEQGAVSGVGSVGLDTTESELDKRSLARAKVELERRREQLSLLVEQRTQELLERDEMFRRFYEVIPDVFMITEMDSGKCLSVNDGFCEMTGYSREEVIDRSTIDLNLWRYNRDRGKLVSALKSRGYISNLNADFCSKDGSFWPGMMSACIAELGGKQVVLSATKDVSDMRGAQDQAIQANLAKSQFLSSMSHELRTPLNAIIGFAQILQFNKKDPLTVRQKNAIELIATSGQHLLELINQVLDLSGIEAGNLELKREPVQVNAIISECISLSRSMGEPRGITIDDTVADRELPVILADPLRFRQVLLNLLSNAIKYSNEGNHISVETIDQRSKYLRICVIDNGPGIADQHHQGMFEPFTRFSDATGKVQGAGIGLSISKQLVEAMDGKIGFDSELGKGSNFWFEMPVADAALHHINDAVALEHDVVDGLQLSDSELVILYIEDHPINVEFMKLFFEDIGNIVLLIATTAAEGLEMANNRALDLILMDIGLPDMSGIEATRILKSQQETREIPVIALSAAAMLDDIERAKAVDFAAYTTKPIQVDAFLDLLKATFQNRPD